MATLDNILEEWTGSSVPLIRKYDRNRCVHEMALTPGQEVTGEGARWACDVRTLPLESPGSDTFLFSLNATFRVASGSAVSTGVAVAFEFKEWSPSNYILLPGAVYMGNDFEVMDVKYPPLWRDPGRFRLDMPVTITPAPRLGAGSNRIEQTTGDTTVPAMGFHSSVRQQGFICVTEQGSRFGNHGLIVERREEGCVRFLVSAPCVREFRQDHCKAVPSDDVGADWQAGSEITLTFVLAFFRNGERQSLFDHFCEVRKTSLNPSLRREELPFSASWKLLEEKYNRDNWVESCGYYKMAPNAHTTFEVAENPLCFLWQLGWVGGGMMTLPMWARGEAETRRRARRCLEMIFDKTQAASGFFLGIGDGERFYSDGFDRPHPHNLHMVRRGGDWLFFALKLFDLFKRRGEVIPAAWNEGIRRLADTFVNLWTRAGQFGQFVDVETGALLVGGSTSGAIIPGALARASVWYDDPRYRDVAAQAATRYYEEFVRQGLSTGGPGDILSAPDSESAFALIESFVALLEVTGDAVWARAARDMARQAATWVVAYDYHFPPGSPLGRSGARSTGAVWANIQNKHGAPGICTLSGDSLFRLWRLTGDPVALDLIQDIAHGMPQYLSRADKPLSPSMKPGWMCERVNLSDWEGAAGVGANLFGSCSWAETALMLTTLEIPGLYVQPDTGFCRAFDNVAVRACERRADGVDLTLANPTRFEAVVKVFAENSPDTALPLDVSAFVTWELGISPGAECRVHIGRNCQMKEER